LPTPWFWNDPENQRLLAPVGILVIPLCVLLNAVQVWLRLGAWVSIVGGLAICVLTQGFVERTIRTQLRLPVRSVARLPVEPFILLSGVGVVVAILVSVLAWGPAQALFTALVLALVMGVTAAMTVLPTRMTTLACAALGFFCASVAAFAAFGLPGLGAALGVLTLCVPLAIAASRRGRPGVEGAGSLPAPSQRTDHGSTAGSRELTLPASDESSDGEACSPISAR
jgi:hypothetical protein